MAIYIGGNEVNNIYVGTSPVDEVYVGTTKVRPSSPTPVFDDYLCFTSLEGDNTLSLTKTGSKENLEISWDKTNWIDYTFGTTIHFANANDKLYWRNKSTTPNWYSEGSYYHQFVTGKRFEVSGDISSLLCKTGTNTLPKTYCFIHLFSGTKITTAPTLPFDTLTTYCFTSMFDSCIYLTTAPTLPATTLAWGCYSDMFSGCTSLVSAPELPATTLAYGCYTRMFYNCTSLTSAPELPATTLANSCYYGMFWKCSSLINPPSSIPATTIENSSCYVMFSGCTSLASAPDLPATTIGTNGYTYMFQDCKSLTTPPKLSATNLGTSCYSSMFQGCTSLSVLLELPATTLPTGCYRSMFSGCTSIYLSTEMQGNYDTPYVIPSGGSLVSGSNPTNMFSGTGGTWTGTPVLERYYYTSNTVI